MVRELPALLRSGDVLVVNDARVIPARVRGRHLVGGRRGGGGGAARGPPLPPAPGGTPRGQGPRDGADPAPGRPGALPAGGGGRGGGSPNPPRAFSRARRDRRGRQRGAR